MKKIEKLLVAGAGMMGKNIAFVLTSLPGCTVALYDLYDTDRFGIIGSPSYCMEFCDPIA